MQCDLAELLFEDLALADISRREHDAADRRVVHQVRRDRLDLAPDAVAVPQPPLEGAIDGPASRAVGD